MKLSVKSDYAARAVLGLSRQYSTGAAVRADDLADEQGIPVNYLVQILIELKAAQIVRSQRGKEGGYLLARPPGAGVVAGDRRLQDRQPLTASLSCISGRSSASGAPRIDGRRTGTATFAGTGRVSQIGAHGAAP